MSRSLADRLLESLLFIVPLLHLLVAPYTKVEESFNLQATHDILTYGTPTTSVNARLAESYDHFAFPGAVPRSFVGATVLAGLSQPLIFVVGFRHAQLVVRAVLAAGNAWALLVFKRAVDRTYGTPTGRWWVALAVTQFHGMFWLSRTVPNMFAYGLTTLAFAFTIPVNGRAPSLARFKQAIGLLTLSAVIFRAELALLLISVARYLLFIDAITARALIHTFLVFFSAALAVSVSLDSYFWQRLLWPELSGFLFNVVKGSASEWGTSPWHYYFSTAVPKILLNPLGMIAGAAALVMPGTTRQTRHLFIPSMMFLMVYSFQPHKEPRFIYYVIPPFTTIMAIGANYISARADKAVWVSLLKRALQLSVLASAAASSAMLLISALNYPGGDALQQLYALSANDTGPVRVHTDVLTCMTGLTLFGQNPDGRPVAYIHPDDHHRADARDGSPTYLFDKTEEPIRLRFPRFWRDFDYALMENSSMPLGAWEVLGTVYGYDGVEVLRPAGRAADESGRHRVLGKGEVVAAVRERVRALTGGWWVGPRMAPKIHVMRRREKVEA